MMMKLYIKHWKKLNLSLPYLTLDEKNVTSVTISTLMGLKDTDFNCSIT